MKMLLTRYAPILMSVLVLGGVACTSAEATLVRDGNETFAEEDWEASLEAYEQAQQEAPELAEPYYNAGNAYYRKQEYGSAQQNIENALRTAEGELPGQANFNLGNTQFQAEEFESAIEAYKETLRLDPDDQDAKYNLELALLQLQQEQPGQQPEGEGDEPQGEQQDQGEEQQEQQDQQPGQGPSPSPEEDQQQPTPEPSEQDQPVPQPQPGELTEEQARQLLEAVASRVQTLQERLQQNVVISSNPPVKDW